MDGRVHREQKLLHMNNGALNLNFMLNLHLKVDSNDLIVI